MGDGSLSVFTIPPPTLSLVIHCHII